MKKIILTMAATLGVAGYTACTYGQGQVIFGATVAAATQVSTNNGTIGKIAGGAGAWEFALYVADSTNTTTVGGLANTLSSTIATPWTDSHWSFTGVYATNSATAGRFSVTDPGQGYVTVPGTLSGSYYNFIIVGWNTAIGGGTVTSLINAYNGGAAGLLYGSSGICVGVLMGNNASPPNTALIGLIAGSQTPGWTLAPIPEPATFALAGLGAAAMLIFRRRK